MPPFPQNVEHKKYVDSLWCIYTVSVASAMNAELVTFPLDLIKTRLQVQGEQAHGNKLGQAPHRGFLRTGLGIVTEEGPFRLWKGMTAVFLRHIMYSGTRIIVYRDMRERMLKLNPPGQTYFPLWQSAICGITAGGFSQFIASPADLVKVQMQMEGKRELLGLPQRNKGIVHALSQIWRQGGIKALWKGAVPNVWRAALVNLGDLTAYDFSKQFILRMTSLPDATIVHILASFCAGLAAATLGTPADVIKTRVMNQPFDEKGRGVYYANTIDCIRKSVRSEGVFALYKGFIPTWIRLGPWALVFWISYEKIMHIIGGEAF